MCHDATFGDVSHFSQCYAADDSGFFAVLLLENVQLFQNRFQKQEEKKWSSLFCWFCSWKKLNMKNFTNKGVECGGFIQWMQFVVFQTTVNSKVNSMPRFKKCGIFQIDGIDISAWQLLNFIFCWTKSDTSCTDRIPTGADVLDLKKVFLFTSGKKMSWYHYFFLAFLFFSSVELLEKYLRKWSWTCSRGMQLKYLACRYK